MKKSSFGYGSFAFAALLIAACDLEEDELGFEVSENAIEVGSTGIYLTGGTRADKPAATAGPNAPKIVDVKAHQIDKYLFNLVIVAENEEEEELSVAYLDFAEHGIYKARLQAPLPSRPAYEEGCRKALASQSIVCTPACIAACDCVSCADADIATSLKQGCAVTCSSNVHSGAIKSAPYYGSEIVLANYVYNGDPKIGIQGTAKQAGCDASSCEATSTSTSTRKKKAYMVRFETPTVPVATPLVAPQVQTNDAAETSAPFGAAKVSICQQGGAVPCR